MSRPTQTELHALAEALDTLLAGQARIEKIWRPARELMLLKVKGLTPARLLIDVTSGHPRVVMTERYPPAPSAPDRTTIRFRKQLENRRVVSVRADARALTFELAPRGGTEGALRVQLAGRYLNIALLQTVEGADGSESLEPMPWVESALALDPDSPPLREGAPTLGQPPLNTAHHAHAYLVAEASKAWADYDARVVGVALARGQRDLAKVRKRLLGNATDIERRLAAAAGSEAHRHEGDLLKTALGRIAPKATYVEVSDWLAPDGAHRRLALDPSLTAVENMERRYALYRKGQRAIPHLNAQLDALTDALITAVEPAEEILAEAAEAAGSLTGADENAAPRGLAVVASALERIDRLLDRFQLERPSRRTARNAARQAKVRGRRAVQPAALPYTAYETLDGTPVWVGKGAARNDELTFKHARGRDIWLHARDCAGSHVILRMAAGGEPKSDSLLDAALLAAWHSKARGETNVDVMWTWRKHIRKPKGAPPGRVTVAESRTLTVRDDPTRRARLYRTKR